MARVMLTMVASGFEAEMLCGELQANGIECWYEKTDAGGALAVYTSNSQVGATTVFVEEAQLEEARKLLPDNQ
jgi:Putative prokaryotic signal transducing protein